MPYPADEYLRSLDRIRSRKWEHILSEWIQYIQSIKPVGDYPQDKYYEIPTFKIEALDLQRDNTIISKRFEIPGLRNLVFREGVYFLHKSSYVIGASEINTTCGLQSWSLSNAYQGALFGAIAILHFCGICFPVVNNKPFILDLFPEREKLSMRKRKQTEPAIEMELFKLSINRIEHIHIWDIFLRLIRILRINEDIWPNEIMVCLKKLDVKEFGKQRNFLHYKDKKWFFEDLFVFVSNVNFKFRSENLMSGLEFNLESDFSFILGLTLLKLGYLLFKDLSKFTNVIKDEVSFFETLLLDTNRHPLYSNFAN